MTSSRWSEPLTQTETKGETQMELSACIVVYNGAQEAIKAAQTVLDCTRRYPLTLYLVDNASPDGSGKRLTAAAKDGTLRTAPGQTVQVLCRLENGGFGTGHNTVLSLLHSRVHFILNPDVIIHDDILPQMAQWLLDHPGVVMATPQLYFPDGRIQNLPRRKPTPWLLLARQLAPRFGGVMQKADEHYTMQDEDLTIPRPIEFCTGSFAAIRTDVFKTIGGFDPEYFMYVEDADLTQRALRQGLVYLLPQFTATHAWHRDPMRDAGKFKMQLKSMGRYFKKWGIGKGNV